MMRIKNAFYVILLFFGMIISICPADSIDDYDKKIDKSTKQLKQLDKQIATLKSGIKKYQQQEKGIIRELDNTQQQISLTSDKIRVQQKELNLRWGKQSQLKKDYQQAQANSEELQVRYKNRVIRAYKLRPNRQWDLFIDAASPREFYYRVKYITAINRVDRQLYRDILTNINLIDLRQIQIAEETKEIKRSVASMENEQSILKRLKSEKEKQHNKIKSDKDLLAQQIQEKEKSKKEIQGIIEKTQRDKKVYLVRLEEERKKREIVEGPFVNKKGKLPWPAEGKIVSNFGKHTHPVLGTITENSGIDIEARNGSPVRAVSDGMVVTVTWLRGFGNTIIVIHDNSYYTVYSHVENIIVVQDEYVDAGQQLASVSDDGSMDGSKLHFELWQEQQKLNPKYWLRN
ncbi:MAG: peptidoglycan DD-metalloendopeptidase family protein [Candidatus Marinimicrobia bacterium]|nr:peptidoglycan DD-metalloendopeptidase family protein [Candidatus Neomarinimicrobiota bacterium]